LENNYFYLLFFIEKLKGSVFLKNGVLNEFGRTQMDITKSILEQIATKAIVVVNALAISFDTSGVNKRCTLNHLDGRYSNITL